MSILLRAGMTEVAALSMLSRLADVRHLSVDGNIYAAAQVAVSFAFAVGESAQSVLYPILPHSHRLNRTRVYIS